MSNESSAAVPRGDASFWALAAIVCAVGSACPIAAGLGLVLGSIALLDVRRHPGRTGRRLALASLAISGAAVIGWGVFARWWDVNVRTRLIEGPGPALRAGLEGDVEAFRGAFVGGGGDAAEADGFLRAVRSRYGRLIGAAQRADDGSAAARNTDLRRPWIPYSLEFESGRRDADARFVIMEPGRGLVLEFSWLAIRDPDEGDLVYPVAETPAAEAPPPVPAGPVPVDQEQPVGE